MPIAAALNTRRCTTVRRIRHWVSASRGTGAMSEYSGGSRIAIGRSQIVCTSLMNPPGSPALRVSSMVTVPQASRSPNSATSLARGGVYAAATPAAAAAAAMTAMTKTASQRGSSQTGQARSANAWSRARCPRPRSLDGAVRPADSVQVAQRLGVGACQAALAVRQVLLLAEGPDQGLGAAQVRAGHGGEQVVLDLVVQAAEGEVGQQPAADVAGGEDLAAQEVTPAVRVEDEHALVVGSEGAGQVQAEKALLYQDEYHGLDGREHQEDDGEVTGGMGGEEHRLPGPVARGPAGQRADARDVDADRLTEQHREEQVRLVPVREPGHAPARARLGGGESQRADHDVGVRALLIGVRVMAVVLVHPPAVAQPYAEVAVQDAEHVVGPPRAEDLPVPGVVAEEANLGEDHRQEGGYPQLPPRVTHQDEGRPSGGQRRGGNRDLPDVVSRAPFEQPRLLDLAGQLGVLAAAWRRGQRGDRPGIRAGLGRCLLRGSHRGNSWEAHRGWAGDVPPGSWAAVARAAVAS